MRGSFRGSIRGSVRGIRGSFRGSFRGASVRGSGLATTPVGRVSVVSVGCTGLRSRPRKTRDRCKSSSSATPGVRSLAPVVRSGMFITGSRTAGRFPTGFSSPDPRRGRLELSGAESITRRATRSSSTGRPRPSGVPKSLRGTLVTPRHVLSVS